MDLTKVLAIWGAIVATAAITWNIVRDIRDKGKLKIDAIIGKEILIDNNGKYAYPFNSHSPYIL